MHHGCFMLYLILDGMVVGIGENLKAHRLVHWIGAGLQIFGIGKGIELWNKPELFKIRWPNKPSI